MRISNSLFYTNATNDYQKNMQELYNTNTQISSRLKIQNSFEDSGIYSDTMRLDYEVSTLEQVTQSTSKAETYANNTDDVLNQMTDTLSQFKTKLIQSASDVNSSTSLNALANELEALKDTMISLGNTSINGQFLFSGTNITTKPLDDYGNYSGNDNTMEALIGSGVTLPYNITGNDLFLGTDSEYNKTISTNVKMFNQSELHPDVMNDSGENSNEVYLSETDTIRDMVGDTDSDSENDPNVMFYVSGRNPDGETFSNKLEIDSKSNVSDLLEQIGQLFGNTTTSTVVNVTMNDHGQIEVEDLKDGNSLIEMNIFGAVDRDAPSGTARYADVSDSTYSTADKIDNLVSKSNVDIIEFSVSNYSSVSTASTVASREDINNPGLYRIGYPMTNSDGSYVDETTTLQSFMGIDVLEIEVDGTYHDITSTTSVSDLLGYISANARLENGQIIVEDASYGGTTLTVRDTGSLAADGTGNLVDAFAIPDAMNYERRGFEKEGNQLASNVSQVVANPSETSSQSVNDIATDSTKLSEVTGTSLDGTFLEFNYIDYGGGASKTGMITFATSGSTFTIGADTYDIMDSSNAITSANDITYKQLTDIISIAVSGITYDNTPLTVDELEKYNSIYEKNVDSASSYVEVSLNDKGQIEIYDKLNSESEIEFSMYDSNTSLYQDTLPATAQKPSALNFMSNNLVTIEEPSIDMFADMDMMIEAVRNGTFRMDSESSDPRNIGIQNSLTKIDQIMDNVEKQHTKIGSYSNALSQANERSALLSVNVQTIRSEVIDVDIGEAYMKFNQLSTSYQASLSTISKINSMSLLNYM